MVDQIIIVGGGVFGLTSALELQQRGYSVTLLNPGPIPHPEAASTDISKVVRMDYGNDAFYMELMENCLERWRDWNDEFGETIFFETGVLFLSKNEMQPGDYEYESLALLDARGHPTERIRRAELAKRFPAWNAEVYFDGYFNPQGGWSPCGRVTALLAGRARKAGVQIVEGAIFSALRQVGGKVSGVKTKDGTEYEGEIVVMAAGSWTPALLPWLRDVMWPTAQAVFHFRPERAGDYRGNAFPVWTAELGRTGWYGFPAQPDGTLKIANHGPGWSLDPSGTRQVPEGEEARFRAFFAESIPGLASAAQIGARLCFYCDTFDTDFWIDHDPERPGLVVSSGGSGHAFKFTPMLGQITADVVEGRQNAYASRFAWREKGELRAEAARFVNK
ncbi:MAG: FAD-dependent oxidoreductase [Chloroflexi bacterium]|nr:FAD-dependent oxidoreductase [Chloroflexota bacterium]MQC26842.1 FAD-dependent oxidoreductase [Chloroflexota bacterium]